MERPFARSIRFEFVVADSDCWTTEIGGKRKTFRWAETDAAIRRRLVNPDGSTPIVWLNSYQPTPLMYDHVGSITTDARNWTRANVHEVFPARFRTHDLRHTYATHLTVCIFKQAVSPHVHPDVADAFMPARLSDAVEIAKLSLGHASRAQQSYTYSTHTTFCTFHSMSSSEVTSGASHARSHQPHLRHKEVHAVDLDRLTIFFSTLPMLPQIARVKVKVATPAARQLVQAMADSLTVHGNGKWESSVTLEKMAIWVGVLLRNLAAQRVDDLSASGLELTQLRAALEPLDTGPKRTVNKLMARALRRHNPRGQALARALVNTSYMVVESSTELYDDSEVEAMRKRQLVEFSTKSLSRSESLQLLGVRNRPPMVAYTRQENDCWCASSTPRSGGCATATHDGTSQGAARLGPPQIPRRLVWLEVVQLVPYWVRR